MVRGWRFEMELRDFQVKAANLLSSEMKKGGVITFTAPAGSGKSIILAASAAHSGNVAYASRRRGKAMGVPPEVAGYMMQNGVGSAEACAVFGVRKRVMIG